MGKETFIIYTSFYKPISFLSDKQLGRLFRAIFRYNLGEVFEVEDDIRMAFEFFKNQLEIDEAKYQAKIMRDIENGRKGGNPNFKKGMPNPYRKKNNGDITNDNPPLLETTSNNPQLLEKTQDKAINDNDNDNDNENENGNNNPPQVPPCGEEDAAKSWRDDFDVYKSELKETFDRIVADEDFIENRQKYHPNVDIRLSLQKAYEDYWNTEAGWKKKKSGRTKEIDWKATFRKALDQPQNRVYKQKDACKPEPERAMSELQERFARYLEKEAPLLLNMPLQPSNEEVGILLKINKNILRDIVKKINNDKYLTTHKNSVFQTIMELKGKQYGT